MTIVNVTHIVHKVSLYFSTPTVIRRLVMCYMATVTKRVFCIEEKIKVLRETGNEKESRCMLGILPRKF
jgi:hypothetical protein